MLKLVVSLVSVSVFIWATFLCGKKITTHSYDFLDVMLFLLCMIGVISTTAVSISLAASGA